MFFCEQNTYIESLQRLSFLPKLQFLKTKLKLIPNHKVYERNNFLSWYFSWWGLLIFSRFLLLKANLKRCSPYPVHHYFCVPCTSSLFNKRSSKSFEVSFVDVIVIIATEIIWLSDLWTVVVRGSDQRNKSYSTQATHSG